MGRMGVSQSGMMNICSVCVWTGEYYILPSPILAMVDQHGEGFVQSYECLMRGYVSWTMTCIVHCVFVFVLSGMSRG
jgi:hypothetical protein